MNVLITNLDIIGAICYLGAFLSAMRLVAVQAWERSARLLAVGVLLLATLNGVNIAQWSGLWQHSDTFEDYIEVTIPLLWLFLMYTIVYERLANELQPYRTMLENTSVGIAIVEEDGTLSLVNSELARLCKRPREEIEGRMKFGALVTEQDAQMMSGYHEARLRGEWAPGSYECTLVDSEGERHDMLMTAAVIPGTSRCVATAQDITQSRQTQRQLQQLAEEQEVLLGRVPVMIFWKDANGDYVRVNQAFADALGMTPEEVIGKSTYDLRGEQAAGYLEDDREVMATGEPKLGVIRPVRTAKGERWYATDKVPYRDAEGKVVGVVGFTVDITPQRQAYEALVAAEQDAVALARFQEYVMQTANVWMTMTDSEGNITLWNQEAERISGYTAEEAVGSAKIWEKLYPDPDYRAGVMGRVHRILAGELEPVDAETRIRCKDGSYKIIAWTSTPLISPDDSSAGMISIGRDMTSTRATERRQSTGLGALKALNESSDSHAMIRTILQAIKQLTDCDAVAIRLREGDDYPYVEAEGVSTEKLQRHSHLLVPGANGAQPQGNNGKLSLRAPYEGLVRGRFDPALEWYTAAGSFWTNDLAALGERDKSEDFRELRHSSCVAANSTSVAIIPLRSAGSIVGLLELGDRRAGCFDAELVSYLEELGSSVGVAVQRQMSQEALRRERNFSHSVVQNAQALIVGLDRHGNITLFNNIAEQVTGYTAEQVVGRKPWQVMVAEQDAEATARPFQAILSGDFPKTFERRWICKDGQERLITWRATGLVDARGEVWQVIAIGLDITEHRQLETRLRHSQRMEAIATLAGGIAHDFNNMLHAVLSNIELMRMLGELNAEQDRKASAIEETVRQAAGIIKQLTALAAPERHEKGSVDLNRCVGNVLAMLEGARNQHTTVVQELQPDLPLVTGDAVQLEQVVMNLCINALQALSEGGQLQVTTRLAQATEALTSNDGASRSVKRYIRLEVKDNGVGMDFETVQQIFDPFFTTRGNEGGTGLGLAVVYGIVQAHGGTIRVETEPGQGSTFTVHLPVATDQVPVSKPPEKRLATGSETIMLVDDNEAVLHNLTQLLTSLGYTTIEASSGPEAIERYQQETNIDLVVLDISMPKMSGIETFAKIRQSAPEAKGLLMTGFVAEDTDLEELPEGIMGVLRKPFTLQQLMRDLRTALAGQMLEETPD